MDAVWHRAGHDELPDPDEVPTRREEAKEEDREEEEEDKDKDR
jgi:hypothetical protein